MLIALLALLHLRLVCHGLTPHWLGLWLLAGSLALTLVIAFQWASRNDQAGLERLPYEQKNYPAWWIKAPEHGIEEGLKAMWGEASGKGETAVKP